MPKRGSTPLVRAGRERVKARALIAASRDGLVPLVYLARFSGRDEHFTIGKTDADLAQTDEPRLGDHTRGAGTITDRLWVKGPHETELRLQQAFTDEALPNEPSWFSWSRRAEAYWEALKTRGDASEDWREACGLDYLRFWPAHDSKGVGVGQVDIFGDVHPPGYEVEDLDDYQTPHLQAGVVRLALERIGLDPATSHGANERVIRADEIYWAHPEHSGLAHEWNAETVYCNPPWSQDGLWARKMLAEFRAGHFRAGILAVGDTALSKNWWSTFGPYPLAQHIGRPAWKQYDGKVAPPCGGVFVYLGDDERRFREAFKLVAHVYGKRSQTPFAGVRMGPTEQWDYHHVMRVIEEWKRARHL